MIAQNSLRFYGPSGVAAAQAADAPVRDVMEKPCPDIAAPMISAGEILWAIIAVGAACAMAMFLTN